MIINSEITYVTREMNLTILIVALQIYILSLLHWYKVVNRMVTVFRIRKLKLQRGMSLGCISSQVLTVHELKQKCRFTKCKSF